MRRCNVKRVAPCHFDDLSHQSSIRTPTGICPDVLQQTVADFAVTGGDMDADAGRAGDARDGFGKSGGATEHDSDRGLASTGGCAGAAVQRGDDAAGGHNASVTYLHCEASNAKNGANSVT